MPKHRRIEQQALFPIPLTRLHLIFDSLLERNQRRRAHIVIPTDFPLSALQGDQSSGACRPLPANRAITAVVDACAVIARGHHATNVRSRARNALATARFLSGHSRLTRATRALAHRQAALPQLPLLTLASIRQRVASNGLPFAVDRRLPSQRHRSCQLTSCPMDLMRMRRMLLRQSQRVRRCLRRRR